MPFERGINWVNNKFRDANGNFDSQEFTDWVNNTYGNRQASNYTGSDAQVVLNNIKKVVKDSNWDNFMQNSDNYNKGFLDRTNDIWGDHDPTINELTQRWEQMAGGVIEVTPYIQELHYEYQVEYVSRNEMQTFKHHAQLIEHALIQALLAAGVDVNAM